MNILFLNNGKLSKIASHSLYTDLIRSLRKEGHSVFVVGSFEKKHKKKTTFYLDEGVNCVMVKTGNTTKCNPITKFLSTLFIPSKYIHGIKKFFKHIHFDIVVYPTPPIAFYKIIKYLKKRDNPYCYLLLKDIFPQNAVDLGLIKKTGLKGLLYHSFRKQEKELYSLSTRIGCMSEANVRYVLIHNPQISESKVEVFPNCIEPRAIVTSNTDKKMIREKYNIPLNKKVFVYGGNLGKPQGVQFIIKCLKAEKNNDQIFFLIVGDGTEYTKIKEFESQGEVCNFKLIKALPKEEYELLVSSCDVGLVFLDYRFTIPNYPSRILSYLQSKLPILACTDANTDLGADLEREGVGWWCESNSVENFKQTINDVLKTDLDSMKNRAFDYLIKNFDVRKHITKITLKQ